MGFYKTGAGKIKEEITVKKDEKTGRKITASKPIMPAEPKQTQPREASDGEVA